MEQWEQQEALEGVRRTLGRYVIATDSGAYEEFFSLFTDDGEFVLPDGSVGVGPTGVAALLAEKGAAYKPIEVWEPAFMRHHTTTIDIEVVSPTEATVEAYFMVCTDRGLDHWGRWVDRLVREADGCWRFRRREVHTEASYPESWYATTYSKV